MFKYAALAISLLMLSTSPASAAEWLIFCKGETKSTFLWRAKSQPVAGIETPSDSVAIPFIPHENDGDLHHYKLINGALVYDVPAKDEAPRVKPPQYENFKSALSRESSISAMARCELANRYPQLFDQHMFKPNGQIDIANAWALLKEAGYSWLTFEVIQKVESLASQYHIPLVGE